MSWHVIFHGGTLVPWGNGTIERAYQLMIVITEEIKSKRYF
jgi:hypothetical protein